MKITDMKVIIALCLTIGGAGYTIAKTFATTDDLATVKMLAAVGVEAEIKNYMKELTLLESKPNKSAYEIARIKYLQEQIARLTKLRSL